MGGKEDGRALHIVRRAPAVRGDAVSNFLITGIAGVGQGCIHLGVHIAGSNAVDGNTLTRQFIAQRLAELCHTALGGCIRRNGKAAEKAEHGSDINDLAVGLLFFQKFARSHLAEIERRGEVDLDHVVPVFKRKIGAGIAALDAGGIDDNIEPAEQRDSLFKPRLAFFRLGKVRLDTLAVKAVGTEIRRNLFNLIARSEDNDGSTRFHQSLRHAVAETAGTAGHDGTTAGQIK